MQVSTIHQQVIIDNVEKTFTVVNLNTITQADKFNVDGTDYQLGKAGEGFRVSLQGVLLARTAGATPPPTGHFSGYAIGVPATPAP